MRSLFVLLPGRFLATRGSGTSTLATVDPPSSVVTPATRGSQPLLQLVTNG